MAESTDRSRGDMSIHPSIHLVLSGDMHGVYIIWILKCPGLLQQILSNLSSCRWQQVVCSYVAPSHNLCSLSLSLSHLLFIMKCFVFVILFMLCLCSPRFTYIHITTCVKQLSCHCSVVVVMYLIWRSKKIYILPYHTHIHSQIMCVRHVWNVFLFSLIPGICWSALTAFPIEMTSSNPPTPNPSA